MSCGHAHARLARPPRAIGAPPPRQRTVTGRRNIHNSVSNQYSLNKQCGAWQAKKILSGVELARPGGLAAMLNNIAGGGKLGGTGVRINSPALIDAKVFSDSFVVTIGCS